MESLRYNYNLVGDTCLHDILSKSSDEILRIIMMIGEENRLNPDRAIVLDAETVSKFKPGNNMLPIAFNPSALLLRYVGSDQPYNRIPFSEAMEQLETAIPFLDSLSFDGYVLAGGLLVKSFIRIYTEVPDADFYPWTPPNVVESERVEALNTCYMNFLNDMTDAEPAFAKDSIITKRNEFCTTIAIPQNYARYENGERVNYDVVRSYQIIHRGHTSPVSTVVGFDQPICKMFYDGHRVYMTLDAALCFLLKINPIDWRRESPSHLQRAYKYHLRGFRPVCPGLPATLFNFPNRHVANNHYQFRDYAIGPSMISKAEGYFKERNRHIRDVREDSDYGECIADDIFSVTYSNLYSLITDRPQGCVVFSRIPNQILTNYTAGVAGHCLKRIMGTMAGKLYTGVDFSQRCYHLMVSFKIRDFSAFPDEIDLQSAFKDILLLKKEMDAVFEQTSKKLEIKLCEVEESLGDDVKFMLSNPGRQYTSSFNSMQRESAAEYWGPAYIPYDLSPTSKAKFTFVCIWKLRKDNIISWLPRDVVKLICRWINTQYLKEICGTFVLHPRCYV